ncbi:hypothetical protein V8G56_01630 [Gaetbulibacter aquiaggeris]|uniref:Uncharacterized protein n=1 Tax=Gaetbulibacter aquiaggeris TaxID=1735373 RepID=A0ABW7MKS1_9FLAO
MKRKSVHFILTILIAVLLSSFLPWWSVMVAAFLTSLFLSLKKSAVFFVPFLAIALLWFIHSYYLSSSNDFILAKKIAVLLPLNGNQYLLLLVTGIIGGIAAGVAAIFGKQCNLMLGLSKK